MGDVIGELSAEDSVNHPCSYGVSFHELQRMTGHDVTLSARTGSKRLTRVAYRSINSILKQLGT